MWREIRTRPSLLQKNISTREATNCNRQSGDFNRGGKPFPTRSKTTNHSYRLHLVGNPSGKSPRVLRRSFGCGKHATRDATGKFTGRWKDPRRNGGTTTSKGINSKFLDGEFHVNPGATAMNLLDAVETTRFLEERLRSKRVYPQRRTLAASCSWT